MRELSGKLNPDRLFENAEPLVTRLRADGSWTTGSAMLARAREILEELSETEQIAVINAHPPIGERPTSALSIREQGYDRRPPPPDVTLRLRHLNEEYEEKFGFRFVVFVNGRSHEALVPVLEARLRGSRAEERATAVREILAIAADRLARDAG